MLKKTLLLLISLIVCSAASAAPAIAFYYGANPPWNELQAFDLVVVDPGHVPNPQAPALPQTQLAAYVSVGEVQPSRAYAAQIPPAWLRGENSAWGSRLIDQSAPGWPQFFAQTVVAPLWAAGYRSFFLDTLDSYHLFAKTDVERAAQEAGMVALITELKQRYPQAQLIFNRGFEILPRTHQHAAFVAAESLFQGFDAGKNSYRAVPQADRDWLLGQFKRITEEYKLPVIAIDYVAPKDRALARSTARQIEALGLIPWVATPDLASIGISSIEVMPRRVLLVHSPLRDEFALRYTEVVRFATMPLNYLGYTVEYVDYRSLPEGAMNDRYAGVVLWLGERGSGADRKKLNDWLSQRVDENLPLAFVNEIGPLLDSPLSVKLGLDNKGVFDETSPVTTLQQAGLMGFERPPRPHPINFAPLTLKAGQPLLTLAKGKVQQVAAAIAPWGGYVMAPYAVATLATGREHRWVIDPFAYFQQALRLPDMPVPDVSTESGRRMLLIHMDGDGFVSRTELPGNPYAGEVVRDRVVKKYALPMAISIIESELSPQGLHPKSSALLENVAREIFRAPHVELASHSYSHPFNWRKAQGEKESGGGYHLDIPGYQFSLEREIAGSINYINTRLAPPGKKVNLFLWTGDTVPGNEALAWTKKVGVRNMNGGDTVATRQLLPTLTAVEGLGLARNGSFQVFAPNQNENVYTNNWTGPFSGFERVIETFEFTETPRRLKPINIYFHTYITTRLAGLRSLEKVFAYATSQDTTPVFASDYAAKVEGFNQLAIARTAQGWRIRGNQRLHTLRLPSTLGLPDIAASRGVAGYAPANSGQYVHLVAGSGAELRLGTQASQEPRLVSANATINAADSTTQGRRWVLQGQVPLQFTLSNVQNCQVRANGKTLVSTRSQDGFLHYQLSDHAAQPLEALCR